MIVTYLKNGDFPLLVEDTYLAPIKGKMSLQKWSLSTATI